MRDIRYSVGGHNYKRVSKAVARSWFNMGYIVGLSACNANPTSPWGLVSYINRDKPTESNFESVCNAFSFYNCNAEMGKYISFYIPYKVDKYGHETYDLSIMGL